MIFINLVNELNFLKNNGIVITVDGKKHQIYFQCSLILGDNLGLNSIFGFVKSFSADYSCRMCKIYSTA